MEHQRILRDAFAEHGGHEIDTQGDSFFVAFRRAKDAVAAAVECQQQLAQHTWPDGAKLRVRMGIHTAEPAAAGERYVGLGVHRAARICAAGHGGQVLVSQTTRELLRDDPLPDVSLRDLGEHQLKDLDEPERLYQLVAPGIEENFPALKTAAPAPFAGREGELAEAATEKLVKRGRPGRRTLFAATFGAAAVGVSVGVLLTVGGGSTAGASVKANSVGRIDSSSGKVASAIPVGASPGGVAVGEGAVWVANTDDNNVSRIDPQTNNLRQTIRVGGGPAAVATGGGAVWVTNGLDGTVSRIDPTVNQTVGDPILVGNGPVGVAYGEGAVWVANSVDGTVSRIDPVNGRTRTLPAVIGASAVTVGFGRVWVASPSAGIVVALDATTGTVEDHVAVGGGPDAIAAGAGAIWVANRADGTVSRIDPQPPAHVTIAIPVGRAPDSLAVVKSGVWVANSADESVMRIDPSSNRVAKTVGLANPPQGIAVSPSGVYVTVRSNGLEHRGGNLRISDAAPDSVDPARSYSPQGWGILSMTNDGLVGFRRVGGIEGVQLVPDLAVALPTPTDGGRTWTFRLRAGVRYSNGRLLQPSDVRTGLERTFEVAPASAGRQYYSNVVGTDHCPAGTPCDLSRGIVTDPVARTITFHLHAPDGDFLAKLALTFAVAVPSGTSAHLGSQGVPATGPYVIAAYRKDGFLKLTRNPMFRVWSADAQPDGYADTLTWNFHGTSTSLLQARAVEHGRADVAPSMVAPPLTRQQLTLLATRYPSRLHLSATATTYWFFLNTHVSPFDDVRVRRAVNYAFDRQALVRLLGLSFAPACQILPPDFPGFRRTCPYGSGGIAGLEQARRLVRSSGKAGARVTVWGLTPRATDVRFMVSVLDSIGFRATLKTIPPIPDASAYFIRINDSRTHTQVGFFGWSSDFPSVAGFLPPAFSCAAYVKASPHTNQDPSEFCNRSVDRLFAQALAAQAANPAAASALWQRAERAILAQAPAVPMYTQQDVSFVSKRVGNFQYNPQWRVLLDQLWVK